MRHPVYRTRSGIDVYVVRMPAGSTEQYGIRRIPASISVQGNPFSGYRTVTRPASFEYVPIADIDPFDLPGNLASLGAYDDFDAQELDEWRAEQEPFDFHDIQEEAE